MSLPVLVVTGFLGAGKTSFINRLLTESGGRRIAAIVNDFGAINNDAELIADRTETVLGLSNGCICCSLQGDLLRTLKLLIDRPFRLDHVVIEASGIADPQGIIVALMDPALWGSVMLDAVLTVVDAEDCLATPARMQDPLWLAQVEGADLLVLAKTGNVDPAPVALRLGVISRAPILVPEGLPLPVDLVLGFGGAGPPRLPRALTTADRFAALEIERADPARMAAFQSALEELAPHLLRVKGIRNFAELTGRSFLFQMVGRRATLTPSDRAQQGCRIVFIGERGAFDPDRARQVLSAVWLESSLEPT